MSKKIIFIILIAVCNLSNAQDKTSVVTSTLLVKGNCGECKERIENAADIKGVKLAKWDEKAQVLTITYKPEKVTMEQVKQAVLKSGHDVGNDKAPETVYNNLPKCCQFRDHKCEK